MNGTTVYMLLLTILVQGHDGIIMNSINLIFASCTRLWLLQDQTDLFRSYNGIMTLDSNQNLIFFL